MSLFRAKVTGVMPFDTRYTVLPMEMKAKRFLTTTGVLPHFLEDFVKIDHIFHSYYTVMRPNIIPAVLRKPRIFE